MDFTTPLYCTLLQQSALDQAQATAIDTRALAAQRMQNVQLGQIRMQQEQATRQALQEAMAGQPLMNPSLAPNADDTPVESGRKNVARLQQEAMQSYRLAETVAAKGGDPKFVNGLRDDARDAQRRATQAQRELVLERQNFAKTIGSIAGAVTDEATFATAYPRLVEMDPKLAQGLALDRDALGAPVYGPRTQATMTALNRSSMTAAEQAAADAKVQADLTRQDEIARRRTDDERKARTADADAALKQSRAKYYDRRTEEIGTKKAKERTPTSATGEQRKAARTTVDAEFEGQEFDNTKERLASDVADRAKRLMVEENIGFDEARDRALEELKPFVTDKTIVKPGFFWDDKKTVKTYTKGGGGGGGGGPPQIKSQAEYDKLPKGARY